MDDLSSFNSRKLIDLGYGACFIVVNGNEEIQPVMIEERYFRNQHLPAFVLFTGLPGSGKTTLARNVERVLFDRGIQVYVLDGDSVRDGLSQDLGFDANARQENQRRIMEVGRLFLATGMVVLVSTIAPFTKSREKMRKVVTPIPFLEVFVKCPSEICERRDPKGLYSKARKGEVQNLTGLSDQYEQPDHPDIVVETHKLTVGECTVKVAKQIMRTIQIGID